METQDTTKINWNDTVILTPNALGWEIWEKYYKDLRIEPPEHGDTIEMQLWEAANIWGASMYNGGKLPFIDTSINLKRCA